MRYPKMRPDSLQPMQYPQHQRTNKVQAMISPELAKKEKSSVVSFFIYNQSNLLILTNMYMLCPLKGSLNEIILLPILLAL